jgi:hypothetical protein
MSIKLNDDGTGNSERDWEIFDILCQNIEKVRDTIINWIISG